jgi:Protein of unknown function, DUF
MTPADHKEKLGVRFQWDCEKNTFSSEETRFLEKYGEWCRSLVLDEISPISPAQFEFVKVSRGKKLPVTFFEKAWVKYQNLSFQAQYKIANPFFNVDQKSVWILQYLSERLWLMGIDCNEIDKNKDIVSEMFCDKSVDEILVFFKVENDSIDSSNIEISPPASKNDISENSMQKDWGESFDDMDSGDFEEHYYPFPDPENMERDLGRLYDT